MKVAFLLYTAQGVGGTTGAIVTQANSLAPQHDVEILSLYQTAPTMHFAVAPEVSVGNLIPLLADGSAGGTRPDDPQLSDVEFVRRPSVLIPRSWDPIYDARADVALEEALPKLKADVLVTVTPGLLTAAAQLVPARTAIVHQEHRSSSQRTAGMEPLLAFAPRADAVSVFSSAMADWLRNRLGGTAPRIEVVPNAIPPGYRPQSALDDPLIVAAGRLAAEKQYAQLIDAFARIADRIPEWRLRIFGDGQQRWDLMGRIRKEGLFDRVELPGMVTDLASEWAKASISALTSQSEGFPLVIQEAMAAGVPVVSYDCPSGPREMIDHGINGLLVGQGSAPGMAAALLDLATDPAMRTTMGKAALAKSASWDANVISQRWVEIYESTVRQRRAVHGGHVTRRLMTAGAVGGLPNPDRAPEGGEGTGVSPVEARRTIFSLLTKVASAVTDQWFAIPSHGGGSPIVVVPMAERERFLDQLAVSGAAPFISLRDPAVRGWPERRGSVKEMVAYLRPGRTVSLACEPWPLVDRRPGLLSQGCTTEVQFWEQGPDGDLHAPFANPYVQQVPHGAAVSTATIDGVTAPTLPLMAGPASTECRFPVDVVYTWVDGADPVWGRARARRMAEVTDSTMKSRSSSGQARFETRDELRYSMRSLNLFAPWVRTIHLVTAGQLPAWLDTDDPRIRIVDHREILPEEALPTFNSHAIETALHRVPGLAEHFIYMNDDVFIGRPVSPETFFRPSGHFAAFPSSNVIGLPRPDDPAYLFAGANNRRLLQEAFGVTVTNTMLHTPHPQVRSVLEEIADRFSGEVEATAEAPFRSNNDIAMLSSLAQHYGLITGAAFVGSVEYAFVNLSKHNVRSQLTDLLRRDKDCFCIADHHDYALPPARVHAFANWFLESYYPIAARWERAGV